MYIPNALKNQIYRIRFSIQDCHHWAMRFNNKPRILSMVRNCMYACQIESVPKLLEPVCAVDIFVDLLNIDSLVLCYVVKEVIWMK